MTNAWLSLNLKNPKGMLNQLIGDPVQTKPLAKHGGHQPNHTLQKVIALTSLLSRSYFVRIARVFGYHKSM